jgi:3',5'-cyclic AMP phosphodiesterase CpdA
MKLLVTSDLHLVRVWRPIVLAALTRWVREASPDALLIAGDIAVAAEADTVLRELRQLFPHGPILIALGNHDFWGGAANGCSTLEATIERFWQTPARRYNVMLLDQENFYSEELGFVGGYGHYDLGFAVPALRYHGKIVSRDHYLRGRPPIETPLRWRDFDWMPGAADVLNGFLSCYTLRRSRSSWGRRTCRCLTRKTRRSGPSSERIWVTEPWAKCCDFIRNKLPG